MLGILFNVINIDNDSRVSGSLYSAHAEISSLYNDVAMSIDSEAIVRVLVVILNK